jgi:hypothetical protein
LKGYFFRPRAKTQAESMGILNGLLSKVLDFGLLYRNHRC